MALDKCPAVLVGLIGVFLMLVISENRGAENERLWKIPFFAALFCKVDAFGKPTGKREMETVA